MPKDADRVAETTATTGTGSLLLGGAILTHRTFAAAFGGVGNTDVHYTVFKDSGEWEVGRGTFLGATNQLQRDTVFASSVGGSKVSFTSGSKTVFISRPAEGPRAFRALLPTDVPVELRASAGQVADLLAVYGASGSKVASIGAGGAVTVPAIAANAISLAGGNAIRLKTTRDGSDGVGVILRTDDTNFFVLLTDNGNADGTWNALRPVYINKATGKVSLGSGVAVANGMEITSGTLTVANSILSPEWASNGTGGGFNLQAGLLQLTSPGGSDTTSFLSNRTNGTLTFQARRDGNLYNANNVYAALSDERIKLDIGAAPGMTDLLMRVDVRRYRLTPGGSWQIGVIAQQAQPVLPDLVEEGEDGMLSFAYSKLVPRLLKMSQELAGRIAAIESALS